MEYTQEEYRRLIPYDAMGDYSFLKHCKQSGQDHNAKKEMTKKERQLSHAVRAQVARGVADSRLKKTGWFGTASATYFLIPIKLTGSPVVARQKGGLNVDIKRIKEKSSSC